MIVCVIVCVIVCLLEMFTDMRDLVYQQQEYFDTIETNISEANVKTKSGLDQLMQAEQYQRSKRKKVTDYIKQPLTWIYT